ncbi:MAG: argininosuccinate lyase [bacterium]|nr:argininosuccinate lyase [bacterium]
MSHSNKLWSGRFKTATDTDVEQYTVSLHFDKRLYKYDILGSIAHVRMLGKCRIISHAEMHKIIRGLQEILHEFESGKFKYNPADEDIHMSIEKRLHEKIGTTAGKLHTARSRNDQIVLDMRLYLREVIADLDGYLKHLQQTLIQLAEKNLTIIMPGFTHLQHAQPVLLSHHLLAYFEMFDRDRDRLRETYRRVNVMPLGAGALAGTSFPIDRNYVAKQLGFPIISKNSIDTVSDRDFIIEVLNDTAILMMHLSRLAEELVLWSTPEFGFIEIGDAFCTGSSIMPQKKNPDVAELIRGKTGRVYGNLISVLTVLKGLPLSYNRDLQEDKEPLFDSIDTIIGTLSVLIKMLPSIKFNVQRMRLMAELGYANATDVADYLTKKGVPFREAHTIVGKLVQYCIRHKKILEELPLEIYQQFHPKFQRDIYQILDIRHSVDSRNLPGGTATVQVTKAIAEAKKRLKKELLTNRYA